MRQSMSGADMPATQEAVLVVGGAGYIGAHVVRQLTESNARAVVLDNLSTGSPLGLIHGETLIRGSVHDTPLVARVLREHGCRTVMHFAASVVAPESVAKPLEYYANNAGGMLSLLQACTAAGVANIVFSSTAAVYGQPERGVATEDSATAPINPYGASKLMCERMLADAA
jgi:UDP-glucose 4-epimerase